MVHANRVACDAAHALPSRRYATTVSGMLRPGTEYHVGSTLQSSVLGQQVPGNTHELSLTLTQPLLRGFGLATAPIHAAEQGIAGVEGHYQQRRNERERLALQREATRLARLQYEGERERLRLGVTDLFRVLQFEDAVGNAELAELAASLDSASAVARYTAAIGQGR